MPPDETLVRQAAAVVVASALSTYAEQAGDDSIVTVTVLSVEDVLKGEVGADTIEVRAPGGVLGDRALIVPGAPRFLEGERYLLFLARNGSNWHVLDLGLGKFSFAFDLGGEEVLVRDLDDSGAWNADGSAYIETRRSAPLFRLFVRRIASGGPVRDREYLVPTRPLLGQQSREDIATRAGGVRPLIPVSHATSNSYTVVVSGTTGVRWNVFPAPVNFFSVGTVPGAPNGGVTAINAAFSSWNGDPNSNVNLVYAGPDPGGHNGGVSRADGANTIAFERDLSAQGISPFTCSGNSFSGTLGLGGITAFAPAQHTHPNGELFYTAAEGDVEMNRGIANCTVLFTSGDFNSAVTHEVGHTLGFRHSDQNRAHNGSCTSDPALECSTSAIMRSAIPNGLNAALQTWDRNAVSSVYPGGGEVAPAEPTGVVATATAGNRVTVTWNAVPGATGYEVYRRSSGTNYILVDRTTTNSLIDTTVTPAASYLYKVYATNAAGTSPDSNPDLATTVIFTDDPIIPGVMTVQAIHLSELRVAVNALRALASLSPAQFTDPASRGVVIKAVHITELRTALNAARSALGLLVSSYTDPTLTGVVIKGIHWVEIRNGVK